MNNGPIDRQQAFVLLSGKPVSPDEAAPVGIFDVIREDLRRISTVQPVNNVYIERTTAGYRGILFSKERPHMFALNGNGFIAKPVEDSTQIIVYCAQLEDAERAATSIRESLRSDEDQQAFNEEFEMGSDGPSVTAVPEQGPPETTLMSGPAIDYIERVPDTYMKMMQGASRTDKQPKGVCGGGVVLNKQGKMLLVKPTNGYGGYDWTFPKGFPAQGETETAVTAVREVREETGYEAFPNRFLGRFTHNDGGTCDYYACDIDGTKPKPFDLEETEAIKWVSLVEALELLNDDVDIKILSQANNLLPKLLIKSLVKRPGSRGGKFYRDEKGDVRYGEKPSEHVKPKWQGSVTEELPEDLRNSVIATMEALTEKFPILHGMNVEMGAWLEDTDIHATKNSKSIQLNKKSWTNRAALEKHAQTWKGLLVDATPEGVIVHEIGHVLDNRLLAKLGTKGYHKLMTELGISDYNDILESPSVYGQENHSERMAEMFSAYWYGKHAADEGNALGEQGLALSNKVWSKIKSVLEDLKKALPKMSDDQVDAKAKRVGAKPLKAGSKQVGETGKVRYGYPGEKGGDKKPGGKPNQAPQEAGGGAQAQKQEQELPHPDLQPPPPEQTPIVAEHPAKPPAEDVRAPDPTKPATPEHTINVAEFCVATGVKRETLMQILKRLQTREKFVSFMSTHLKDFNTEHGLENDYYTLMYNVLTGKVPEGQPGNQPKEEPKKPASSGKQPPSMG